MKAMVVRTYHTARAFDADASRWIHRGYTVSKVMQGDSTTRRRGGWHGGRSKRHTDIVVIYAHVRAQDMARTGSTHPRFLPSIPIVALGAVIICALYAIANPSPATPSPVGQAADAAIATDTPAPTATPQPSTTPLPHDAVRVAGTLPTQATVGQILHPHIAIHNVGSTMPHVAVVYFGNWGITATSSDCGAHPRRLPMYDGAVAWDYGFLPAGHICHVALDVTVPDDGYIGQSTVDNLSIGVFAHVFRGGMIDMNEPSDNGDAMWQVRYIHPGR